MSQRTQDYAVFAKQSFSWLYIEKPAFDRALNRELRTGAISVLDIGSGSGRILNYHIQRGAEPSSIVGIEPDPTAVEIARGHSPETKFINQRIQDAELPSDTFDVVTANLALRYLSNDELGSVLEHLHSALKDGGVLFMLDVHPARYSLTDGGENYFKEGKREVKTPWGGKEKYFYRTIGRYTTTIAEAGFTIVSLDECPIDEGAKEVEPEDHEQYSASPARFAITARK